MAPTQRIPFLAFRRCRRLNRFDFKSSKVRADTAVFIPNLPELLPTQQIPLLALRSCCQQCQRELRKNWNAYPRGDARLKILRINYELQITNYGSNGTQNPSD